MDCNRIWNNKTYQVFRKTKANNATGKETKTNELTEKWMFKISHYKENKYTTRPLLQAKQLHGEICTVDKTFKKEQKEYSKKTD